MVEPISLEALRAIGRRAKRARDFASWTAAPRRDESKEDTRGPRSTLLQLRETVSRHLHPKK